MLEEGLLGVFWSVLEKGWLPPSGEVLVYEAVRRGWPVGFSVTGAQDLTQGGAASESGDIGGIDEYQVGPWQAAGKDQ